MEGCNEEKFNYCCWESEFPDIKKKNQVVILFTGTSDENGNNWCSDCTKAKPKIEEIVIPALAKRKIDFITITCGVKDEWKNPQHVLRIDPTVALTGVPTLVYLEKGKVIRRLNDDQCGDDSMLHMFVEE